MKGEIKKKYQEYVNHIDFPIILYVYESNKIIAMNRYAIEIVGENCEDVRDIFDGKKHKLSKELLQGSSTVILNKSVILKTKESGMDKEIIIDADLSVIMVDNVHYVLMLFEESSKNMFTTNMSINVPRVSWKYVESDNIYINDLLRDELEVEENKIDNIYLLDKMLDKNNINKMIELEKRIIETGHCQFNSIQMISCDPRKSQFIKVNRMPIVNSSGENTGIISIHNIILNKSDQRKLYDDIPKDNRDAYNIYEDILDNVESDVLICLEDRKVVYNNKKFSEDYEYILDTDMAEFFIRFGIEDKDKRLNMHQRIDDVFNGINEKGNKIIVYDGFNDREMVLIVKKILWKNNQRAFLFTFNELVKGSEALVNK